MSAKKDLSERDICTKYINPPLEKVRWNMLIQVREEVSFADGNYLFGGKELYLKALTKLEQEIYKAA